MKTEEEEAGEAGLQSIHLGRHDTPAFEIRKDGE